MLFRGVTRSRLAAGFALAVTLAVLSGNGLLPGTEPSCPSPLLRRYPELWSASPSRAAGEFEGESSRELSFLAASLGRTKGAPPVEPVSGDWRDVLRARIERGSTDPFSRRTASAGWVTSVDLWFHAPWIPDEREYPVAWALREATDPDATSVLLRVAGDRELAVGIRWDAMVALARPTDDGTYAGLVELALDREAPDRLRMGLLRRLDRFGRDPDRRLHALLYRPQTSVSRAAACGLALAGDPEALELVVDGLRHWRRDDSLEVHPALRAIACVAGDDPAFLSELAGRSSLFAAVTSKDERRTREAFHRDLGPRSDQPDAELLDIADAFANWIRTTYPDRSTAFSRAWEKCSEEAERRAAEFAPVREMPDEELDTATVAGTLLSGRPAAWLRLLLLSELVRQETEGLDDPRDVVAVLSRHLHRGGNAGTFASLSDLGEVLHGGGGNCVGLTAVYLAVGECLGLPLRAVQSPGHVFVRYDDGRIRFNVETTAGGELRMESDYWEISPELAVPEALRDGTSFLRDLTTREFLAIVETNFVMSYLGRREFDAADQVCREVLRLAPDHVLTQLVAARVSGQWPITREDEALEHLRRAEGLRPFCPWEVRIAVDVLLGLDRPQEALDLVDRCGRKIGDPPVLDELRERCRQASNEGAR